MIHRTLFLFLFSLICISTRADCLEQTDLSLKNHEEDRESCKAGDMTDHSRCMLIAVIRFTESACLSSQKASGKVLQVLWQDLDKVRRDPTLRKLSREEYSQELRKRFLLIREEEELGVRRMREEMRAMHNSQMRSIKDASLLNLIETLGGVVSKNSTDIFTYTIRGRTTTCTTNGNIVNCN